MRGEVGFEAFGQFATGEQDVPPAAFTFEADISAKACDGPFIGTARVLFAQAQVVVKSQVREHG